LKKKLAIRWGDCDLNRHVRHSAYYDFGAHVRIRFFSEMGFDTQKMGSLNIGPILFKEECAFIRELHLEDTIFVNLLKGDVSPDGSRWELHHEIFNSKQEKSAHITVKGAWMDLIARKLTKPPAELVTLIDQLESGTYYSYKK